MNTYLYSLPTTAIKTTFDYGIVEASNEQEAFEKAKEQLKYDFDKVNEVLNSADVTLGFELGFDVNAVEVELLQV